MLIYFKIIYSMTLVSFYRVTELVGAKSARFEKISSKIVPGSGSDGFSGRVVADTSETVGGKTDGTAYRFSNGSARVGYSQYVRKWDGKEVYFNHLD